MKYWSIGDRHFLGLAQGLALPSSRAKTATRSSSSGTARSSCSSSSSSRWAYNWHPFELNGQYFVAHTDHITDSVLYRWDGSHYVLYQSLLENSGRTFAHFTSGDTYLVAAGLAQPPSVLRWDGARFVATGNLDGLGTRELRVVEKDGRTYLIRVNFILGTPADPRPSLISQIYEWRDGGFVKVADFPTTGGTDAEVINLNDRGTR
ncbi:EPTP domain-containing protein [Kribbella sp. VKM Ac-2568]|nr:EPTP domain-containing protein [Kribbella sp. VKM Ac-2568]